MCLAIPGKIVSIANETDVISRPGKVSFGGILKEVNLCFLPEAVVGDYVLVHVGVALSVVDEELAHETLNYLQQMGELDELVSESDPGSMSEHVQTSAPESETESKSESITGPIADQATRNGEPGLNPKSGEN